jgi:pimeloyl-ACP methyl ester carboxylesterase
MKGVVMKHLQNSLGITSLVLLVVFAAVSVGRGQNAAPTAPQKDGLSVQGFWLGALDAGGTRLRLLLKVRQGQSGALTATLDSIDQSAKDVPIDVITQEGSLVRFEAKKFGMTYEGTLNESGSEITGTFKQGAGSTVLVFKRTAVPQAKLRPQEPKKPYPYDEEEIGYENKKDGVHLAGTLTLPRGQGPYPAVLLITGSGTQDRNETIAEHHPFLVLADYLTRHGIAVLRVDDRGAGGSSLGSLSATSENFAGDVRSGIEYLKSRKEINAKQIGLAGHSEGGMIAPMVAASMPDVAFVVIMAGLGQTGGDILLKQNESALKAGGVSAYSTDQALKALKQVFAIMKEEPDNAAATGRISDAFLKRVSEMNAEQKAAFAPIETNIKASLPVFLIPWYRFFIAYDPRPTLMKVTVPVLAINGELDRQVSAKENLELIAAALKDGGNKDYTTVVLPKLNHLLQTSQTGALSEYEEIQETFAPIALETITNWIVKHTTPQAAVQTPAGKPVSAGDLTKLRWIEGTWRGTGDAEKPFFERYYFENESTLAVEGLTDEKVDKVSDLTRFELRDGKFGGGSEGSRWDATEITADSITFEPVAKARNSFRWRRVSKDVWEAILDWPATDSKPARHRVYKMERWPAARN